jgi:hypothetical protein
MAEVHRNIEGIYASICSARCLVLGFLPGFVFNTEDGGDAFL